jgi:23S rRNA (uracil1939-C5)-methyltransferase
MSKNKNYIIESILVTDFAAEGKCIIKNEGEVIFIEGANIAPGDEVKVLVKKTKKSYAEGRVLEILKPSADRIKPHCEHFGVCGGCKWQHIPYDMQLAQKNKQVLDQLTRLGKIDVSAARPILGSAKTKFYRNKLEYTFSNSRWFLDSDEKSDQNSNALGFHIPRRFEKVLPVSFCYHQADPSNAIRNFFREWADKSGLAYYDHVAHVGFFRTLMIRTTSIGQVMVFVQFAADKPKEITEALEALSLAFPDITAISYTINTKRNDSYFDLDIVNFKGQGFIEEKMEDLTFRIGVKSFYQTNSEQAYELYKIVRDLAEISPENLVYDLYTGTGTIANFVAKKAKKVIGVEYIDAAIADAKVNAELNNIKNTEFFAGDMAKIFTEEFVNEHGKPDIIITDPPRAGMDKAVVEVLLKILPSKIVYVSCNAATQARDLALLKEKYTVSTIQPVDMFPHTFHVENVVLLNLA